MQVIKRNGELQSVDFNKILDEVTLMKISNKKYITQIHRDHLEKRMDNYVNATKEIQFNDYEKIRFEKNYKDVK